MADDPLITDPSGLPDFRSLSFAALLDAHLKPEITEARGLIETAAELLRRIDAGEAPAERLEAVTWRLADALLLLGQHGARECPGLALPGVTGETGRGARLLERPPAD